MAHTHSAVFCLLSVYLPDCYTLVLCPNG